MNGLWKRFHWVKFIAAAALSSALIACGASHASTQEEQIDSEEAAVEQSEAEEAATAEEAKPEDVLLATFAWKGEEHTITLAELLQELEELPSYHKRRYEGREGRQTYLALMAESRIALERAMELGLEDDPVVEAKTEELRRKILLDAVEKVEVEDKAVVTDEAAEDYYNRNLEKYHLPERVRLLSLAVKDEEQAGGYLKEIKDGTRTFDEIVKQLSEDGLNEGPGGRNNGDTGLFAQDSFVGAEPFTEAAFALEVGQMTEEVFSLEYNGETYFMLFRLEERAEPYQQTLEEVIDRARRSAEIELTEAREAAWASELEQIGQLTLYPDRLPEPPMRDVVEETPENGEESTDSESSKTDSESSKGKELVPADEVVFADLEMDAATVLAEWTWDGVQRAYTWGQLQAHFDELRPYRKSRYAGVEGWTNLVKERALEELKVLEAEALNLGKTDEDAAQLAEYRRQLMIEQLYEKEIKGMADISEERLMAYYKEHASEYVEPEKARLTCITLLDDKEAADKLFAELVNGRDIAEAAQTLSEAEKNQGPGGRNNGDTGFITRNTFAQAEAFTEAVFSTEAGQIVSEVVVQPLGEDATYYMIFRVEEKMPQRQQTFEEVRSTIEKAVGKIAREERLNEWLTALKERTNLTIYPERLPEDPPPEEENVEETPEGGEESTDAESDPSNIGNVEGDNNSVENEIKINVEGENKIKIKKNVEGENDSIEIDGEEAETNDEESPE
ncbi:MAG: peptidylprolyl isomerase [Candidatus Poribacteria bacterium]|nr:peptidylprolyl isomerase [Candidatus Poribacteria bacterium]